LNLGLNLHIHLHARGQNAYRKQSTKQQSIQRPMTKFTLMGLIDNLEATIAKMVWNAKSTAWADYYNDDSYTPAALVDKQRLVSQFIAQAKPTVMWDFGANTGLFSRLASQQGIPTIAFDMDPGAVELNYREVVSKKERNLLPLVLDLSNPSPAIGWANQERSALIERGPVDLLLALALVHHLAISNNLPLEHIAKFFSTLCSTLIIEFVPKEDPKVQKLLRTRQDIFPDYTQHDFETAFGKYFALGQTQPIQGSLRILYLMRTK
jgi:hypothetical protein